MPTPNGQLYAMYVIFKDGNKRIRYSRDFKNSRAKKSGKRDKLEALKNCFSYLRKRENQIKTFEIYDHHPGKPADGEKVFKWSQDIILVDHITHLVRQK